MSMVKTAREFKGKSLLEFPIDYVVIDIETTGFNPRHDDIIEVACIKYENNCEVDAFSSLVHINSNLSPFITQLTGITDEDLADAPPLEDVIERFIKFVSNYIIVGHNVSFDINFLYDRCMELFGIKFSNDYVDTLTISRKKITDTDNCKLSTIANYFEIDTQGAHRALNDCYITNACLKKLENLPNIGKSSPLDRIKKVTSYKPVMHGSENQSLQLLQGILLGITCDNVLNENEVLGLKGWMDENSHLSKNFPFSQISEVLEETLADNFLEQSELDRMLKLFKQFANPNESFCDTESKPNSIEIVGKKFCLTGEFENIERKKLEEVLKNNGGFIKSISKQIDFLIIGSLGSEQYSNGNYGSKTKKAIEINSNGGNIKIIKENDFLEAIAESE